MQRSADLPAADRARDARLARLVPGVFSEGHNGLRGERLVAALRGWLRSSGGHGSDSTYSPLYVPFMNAVFGNPADAALQQAWGRLLGDEWHNLVTAYQRNHPGGHYVDSDNVSHPRRPVDLLRYYPAAAQIAYMAPLQWAYDSFEEMINRHQDAESDLNRQIRMSI
eukprot:COSAG06_NODE_11665_length_1479_cov_2.182609_1_plen_166_part_10